MKKKLQRLLRAYVNAEIIHSWKGGGDPMDYKHKEEELRKTKEKLWKMLDEIISAWERS